MANFYNENDPFAAAWLRNLIVAGLIPDGLVDERSIIDLEPSDLAGFRQCHFFAGVSGWSLALQMAGIPEDFPIWTGSCPCQPFSVAGKRKGFDDERDLWPEFFRLIRACRPRFVIGEQVSAACATVGQGEGLQAVRDREAVFRVLRELKEVDEAFLQGLRQRGREAEKARQSRTDSEETEGLEAEFPGSRIDECGPSSGEIARNPIRSRPSKYSRTDRRRSVRVDWDSVLSGYAESLERPITRSDQAGRGLHQGECARDPLRRECDGEYMGRAEDYGDCVGDFSEAEFRERALASLFDDGTEAADQSSWLSRVFSDLDGAAYAVGWANLPACSVGAPHRRERLFWGAMANAESLRRRGWQDDEDGWRRQRASADSGAGGVGDAEGAGLEERADAGMAPPRQRQTEGRPARLPGRAGFWGDAEWRVGADGKARRVKPGICLLSHGFPNRVGLLRGFGNAIVSQVGAKFISAFIEAAMSV